MAKLPELVREQAVDTLTLLIRFDDRITQDESRVLMQASKIIASKGLPK
jgi:hypothetical protein